MKSPGELMEKRRKTHQHGLQHGEIRCEHTHIYIYIHIHINAVIYIFPCVLFFCSYVDSMLVVPMCFLIFRSETFLVLLLTNSHSTRFKPIVNYIQRL